MDLKNTVNGMCSEDWKERFVAEYQQLCERIYRLHKMIVLWENHRLNYTPQSPIYVLQEQLQHMERYRDKLEYRAICEDIDLRK